MHTTAKTQLRQLHSQGTVRRSIGHLSHVLRKGQGPEHAYDVGAHKQDADSLSWVVFVRVVLQLFSRLKRSASTPPGDHVSIAAASATAAVHVKANSQQAIAHLHRCRQGAAALEAVHSTSRAMPVHQPQLSILQPCSAAATRHGSSTNRRAAPTLQRQPAAGTAPH
jgi:hypothetical protein